MKEDRNYVSFIRENETHKLEIFVMFEKETYEEWLESDDIKRNKEMLEKINMKDMHVLKGGVNASRRNML